VRDVRCQSNAVRALGRGQPASTRCCHLTDDPPPVTVDLVDRLAIFRSLLAPIAPGRYLDLGTGHGKFALIAHDLGWDVTAVDARKERMPMTPGIRWELSDVRDYEIGEFDCVAILGLLYHLELNDQIDVLRRASRSQLVIVDTHYALSAKVEVSGIQGQWFEEKLTEPTASWRNERSFWPTKPHLLDIMYGSGYSFVWELAPPYHENRNFFVLNGGREIDRP